MKTIRQSNFELLRLVCMLIIVIYHVFIHIVIPIAGNERVYAALITVFHIGVLDFVMISGYFGIKHSWNGFKKLYGITVIYSLLGLSLKALLGGANLTIYEILTVIFPFSNGVYWFMTTYFVLYLIAPYFDMVLKKLGNKEMIGLVALLFYIVVVYGFVVKKGLGDGRSIIAFLLMYTIGRFLHNNEEWIMKIPMRRMICFGAFLVLFLLIAFLPSPLTNYVKGLAFPYNSPGLYVMATLFFTIFMGWDFKSRAVNTVATSTLAIYLIHGNRYVMEFSIPFLNPLFENNCVLFNILMTFGVSLAIFILCIMIDLIRRLFLGQLNRLVRVCPSRK